VARWRLKPVRLAAPRDLGSADGAPAALPSWLRRPAGPVPSYSQPLRDQKNMARCSHRPNDCWLFNENESP
jgi:hypothetical protein